MLAECEHLRQHLPGKYQRERLDKGHGRAEKRRARVYELKADWLDKRWKDTHIASLIVIDRERLRIKDKASKAPFSSVTCPSQSAKTLFDGVRNHWSVEADNYSRDGTLGADKIRCKDATRSRMIASVINTALNLMRKQDKKGKPFERSLTFVNKLLLPVSQLLRFL